MLQPNGFFWPPWANVTQYTQLGLTVGQAVAVNFPNETLIGPAAWTIDLSFLEACFRAGMLQYWDGVSVHPYRLTGPETTLPEFAALRALIDKYAPSNKSVAMVSGQSLCVRECVCV